VLRDSAVGELGGGEALDQAGLKGYTALASAERAARRASRRAARRPIAGWC